MKIVAGIDFGTSMSMIQMLDHHSAQPQTQACQAVRFTQSAQAATPTLVRVDAESGNEWFGEEAQNKPKGVMYQNFKLNLWSDDAQQRQQAQDLVERFFRYLYTCYQEEKNKLYPGAQNAPEETVVGYPVQWSETERGVILNAARKAGFKNVRGMDEASASVLCVMTHNQEILRQKGYLVKGCSVNVMVLDMGAGTTDLAFVRVSEGQNGLDIQPLGTWPPKDYPEVFGGSRIDTVLAGRMKEWLVQCGAPEQLAGQMIASTYLSLKRWKELNVSGDLRENAVVDGCSALDIMLLSPGMNPVPFPTFDRAGYEEMMAEELKRFVRTVQSAPEKLRSETDLVFVTGGNSQWYWVEDILTGKNTAFGDAGLPRIKGKPDAIQRTTYPTETVSRGLVYQGQGICFVVPPEPPEPLKPPEPPKPPKPPKTGDPGSSVSGGTSGGKKKGHERKVMTGRVNLSGSKIYDRQAKENIFIEWKAKRAQCSFPDMKMMERLYIDMEVSLVVTDSGRVLSTTPNFLNKINNHNYSALRDVEAIVASTAFRTRDNRLLGRDGHEILSNMAGRTYKGVWLDADGHVLVRLGTTDEASLLIGGEELNTKLEELRQSGQDTDVMYRVQCWDQPLHSMQFIRIAVEGNGTKVAVGLTKKGSLMTRRPDATEAIRKMFPMLSQNPDGTLGGGIVDFRYRDDRLVLLTKDGTLRLCKKGEEKSQVIAPLHIAHIAFVGTKAAEIWALDDFGNLRRWLSGDNYQNDLVMMKECIACADYYTYDLLAMDAKGKVKYVHSRQTSGKRRREVAAWNIHDQ